MVFYGFNRIGLGFDKKKIGIGNSIFAWHIIHGQASLKMLAMRIPAVVHLAYGRSVSHRKPLSTTQKSLMYERTVTIRR